MNRTVHLPLRDLRCPLVYCTADDRGQRFELRCVLPAGHERACVTQWTERPAQ